MATYKTPGVYVEEISTLPPSVAEVATAIPAFIGYTEITGSDPDASMVKRITSMLEYRQHFGGAPPVKFTATINKRDPKAEIIIPSDITLSAPGSESKFLLYYSLKSFFENGGGPCYVVSVGSYSKKDANGNNLVSDLKAEDFIGEDGSGQGLKAVALLDEPTLLLFPDAVNLSRDGYKRICDAALDQCQRLGDRFTIMDVRGGKINEPTSEDHGKTHAFVFRDKIRSETEYLKYGAAYTPFLNTLIPYEFQDENIAVKDITPDNTTGTSTSEFEAKLPSGSTNKYLSVKYTGIVEKPSVIVEAGTLEFKADEQGKLNIKIPADPTTITEQDFAAFNAQSAELRGDFTLQLIIPESNILLAPVSNPESLNQKLTGKIQSSGSTNVLEVIYIGAGSAPEIEITTTGEDSLDAGVNISIGEVNPASGKLTIIIRDAVAISADDFLTAWGGSGHTRSGYTVNKLGSGGGNITARTATLAPVQEFFAQLPSGNNPNFLHVKYTGAATPPEGVSVVLSGSPDAMQDPVAFSVDDAQGLLTITLKDPSTLVNDAFMEVWNNSTKTPNQGSFTLTEVRESTNVQIKEESLDLDPLTIALENLNLKSLNSAKPPGNTTLYSLIRQLLGKQRLTLPPSPAMAGVYARVDRVSGVWKTPANVSLLGLSGPTHSITNDEQDGLNVDAVSGKSINAIRSFTGKGTLVWGGRTLAGNDNEWRYISVRRLFNLIEESVQKSTSFAVFESNDSTTWLKVKAMIDSYLYGLWQQGALAGSTPEQAFFVNVGLGKTMTSQDILEGRMNIEIGLAAVRPAEFIILKFSHKLQEA